MLSPSHDHLLREAQLGIRVSSALESTYCGHCRGMPTYIPSCTLKRTNYNRFFIRHLVTPHDLISN